MVGSSIVGGVDYATEWSRGSVTNLGGLPGFTDSVAYAINDAGQAVGSSIVGGQVDATEWSRGSVINLGGLPGSTSVAYGINDAGQAGGIYLCRRPLARHRVEWRQHCHQPGRPAGLHG